ncbi:MAG: hypothetical protein JWM88_2819 [Verrucomicrobia bacterium]|nr:hypothetical protein [Verrucomicrobiota bacterium]
MSWVTPPALWLVFGVAVSASAAPSTAPEISAAWELVARHLPGDALARLKKTPAADDREAAFARAVIRMDSQAVANEPLREVAGEFLDLARGADEIAQASAYLAGRLYQVHFFEPDCARAAEIYQHLASRHPESDWAQLALVKLALLKLYVLPEPAKPAERVAAAETLLARLTLPELRRDLHLAIGRARLFHGLPGALPHLLAAAEAGGLEGVPRSDLQVQIGELSRRGGDFGQARIYFGRFLAENDVDPRGFAVRERLREMAEAGEAGAAR